MLHRTQIYTFSTTTHTVLIYYFVVLRRKCSSAIDGIEARAWLQTSSVYQTERSRCADTTRKQALSYYIPHIIYTHNLIIHAPLYNGERGAVDAKEAG